jgi:hypothetical protein
MKGLVTFLVVCCEIYQVGAQQLVFRNPVPLPAQINTSSEEISPLLSPDGKTLYFVRAFDPRNVGGRRSGMDIWSSTMSGNAHWSEATNERVWNNKLNNAVVGIRKDNRVVYLLNSYNKKSGIAFSTRRNGTWTTPEVISIPGIKKLNLVGFYMNPSFNVLIISMVKSDSVRKEDLYVSLRDSADQWGAPINLGPVVNSVGFETAPFLSEDGRRLYFSSDGHQGFGEADIFVSERLYDSWVLWGRPRNLGKEINSEKFDSYFSIYGDSLCFFSSNRASDFSDIYQSKIVTKEKVLLSDSVERIINDAKRLLVELKSELGDPIFVQRVSFRAESADVTAEVSTQIKQILGNSDLRLLSVIQLISTKSELNQDRVENLTEYLTTLGIAKSKIRYFRDGGKSGMEGNVFEVRIYQNEKR